MERAVVGVFESPEQARVAVDGLGALGIEPGQIGSAMSEATEVAHHETDEAKRTGQGALAGGVAGGVLGAITGGLAAVVVPGGGLIVAGVLVAALAGAGAGATGGALLGGLIGLGIADEEAREIERCLERGHILLSVHVPRRQVDPVRTALLSAGAHTVAVDARYS